MSVEKPEELQTTPAPQAAGAHGRGARRAGSAPRRERAQGARGSSRRERAR